MSLEIHQPEIQALIEQRLASDAFHNVEEVLLYALRSAPVPAASAETKPRRMGSELLAAMQTMPYKDIDLELSRPHMQLRLTGF